MAIKLGKPILKGKVSVEEAVKARRTVRNFEPGGIKPEQLSTLCWAGQGITAKRGPYRAAPSAGALYPIFLYVALGPDSVAGLDAAIYVYQPQDHALDPVKKGDVRGPLASASLEQTWMSRAAVMFLVAADYRRITPKYGRRGIPYAHYEAGLVAENILLESVALGLGAGIVGAFQDERVIKEAGLGADMEPMLLLPVGHKGKER
ncbi:MAG: SagB/ThcOx family dehydrogenase [Kiritimatiellaceae bacterium]|nr:SagB/ThcOx family dehydrogenase [Kiritimatiellaceae bacterium]